MLLNGEHAVCARCEPAANELLQAHFAKLQCSIDVVAGERRRLADPYQAAFIGRGEASGSAERRLEVWRDLSAPLVADLEAWMRAGKSRAASLATDTAQLSALGSRLSALLFMESTRLSKTIERIRNPPLSDPCQAPHRPGHRPGCSLERSGAAVRAS